MELTITNEVKIIKEYTEGIFKMPDEPFFWQRWNYRQICGIVPIYTEYKKEMYNQEEEIKNFRFVYFDDSESLVKTYSVDDVVRLINRINVLKKEGIPTNDKLNGEENRIRFLLDEYREEVERQKGYVYSIKQETALKHINGFIENFKDKLFK